MSLPARKRFYQTSDVAEDESISGNWLVRLDGKAVHTPRRALLTLPSRALAEAIAQEWREQPEQLDIRTMHMMTLACTAIDAVAPNVQVTIQSLLPYLETDQIAFRVDNNDVLAERQAQQLDPWVRWAQETHGIALQISHGIMPVIQPAQNQMVAQNMLEKMPVFELAATAHLVELLRSMVLALAVVDGVLAAQQAFALSNLEEHYQMEQWGREPELVARLERIKNEVMAAEQFILLLRS